MKLIYKLCIIALPTLMFFSCRKDVVHNPPPALSFDTEANSSLMMQDGESVSTMTARSFQINKLIKVTAINDTQIVVSNFAPIPITNAVIVLKLKNDAKEIQLFTINAIRPHAVATITYPFITGNSKTAYTDGSTADLSAYRQSGIPVANIEYFDFTGETELIKKLKSFNALKWKIQFTDFDANHDPNNNWKDYVTPKDFRRWTGAIINLAYLFVQEQTKTEFINEPITDNNGASMSVAQKETAYQKFLNISKMNVGVVVNLSGLGGGATFGVAEYVLNQTMNDNPCYIAIHEMGHMIDFGHSSTMTYPANGKGAVEATGRIWKQLKNAGQFPVTATNYYMSNDLK